MMTEGQLKEILESNSQDVAALRALGELYGREDRFQDQVHILKVEAQAVPDPGERAWLTYCRAQLEYEKLQDSKQALASYASVQGDEAWERLAFCARDRILRDKGDMEGLAALLAERPGWAKGEELDAQMSELARILAHRLNRPEEALEILREILGRRPDDLFSAFSLIQILVSSGDWEEVVRIYRQLVELARVRQDSVLSAALAFRLGQIYEGRLNSPEQALEWYQAAAGTEQPSEAGKPAGVGLSMVELLESRDHAPNLAEWISLLIQQSADADPVMFELYSWKLARLQEADIEKSEGSGQEQAEKTLEGLLEKKPDHILGLLALQRMYTDSGDKEKLARVKAGLKEIMVEPRLRLHYLDALARIAFDDLDKPDQAWEYAEQARQLAPERIGPLKFLQYLCYRKQDWTGLVALVDEEIDKTGDPRELQGLYFWRAEVAGYGLRNPDMALESFRQTLEIPPSQLPALKGLERLYREKGDWENLIRVITALARLLTEKEYKVHYSLLIAGLWEEKLNRDDLAFNAYSEVLKEAPENCDALFGLARICRRQRAWDNFIAVKQRLIDIINEVPLRHALVFELAEIHEREFGQIEKARDLFQSLTSLWPENALAYEELRRQSFKERRFSEYFQHLKELEERADTPEWKAAFMMRSALVQEAWLGELGPARSEYERAFGILANPVLFLPLLELAQIQNDWERYSELAQEFSPRFHTEVQSALVWHIAQVMSENLSSGTASLLPLLSKAHELSPEQNVPTRALGQALFSEQNYSDLLELLEKELGRRTGPALLELRLDRAEILAKKHGDENAAIQEYLSILQETGDRADILRILENLYERKENWTELIRIILKEVSLREDTSLLISLYFRLARLYEEKFSAHDQAIKAYQAVQKLKPDHLKSLRELARLFEKTEDWQELVKTLESEIPLLQVSSEQVELYSRAAKVYDEKLGQVEQALESLQKALELDPSREETLHELERIYEREERHGDLIEVLEKQIALNPGPDILAEIYSRIAALWEDKLEDDAKAIESYLQVRELKPQDEPTLRALERLFEREGRWEELVDTLERLSELVTDPLKRTEFYLRIGSLWENKLDMPEPAIQSLRRVLEVEPRQVEALRALDRLYQRTGNYSALVEVLLSLVEAISEDVPQTVELLLRVGRIQEDQFQNDDQALAAYGDAMARDSSLLAPIRAARAIHERRGEWKDVIGLWDKEEPLVPEPDDKKQIFFTIGDILEHRLDKRDEATVRYEKALELDAEYLPAVKPLAEIYFDAGAWEKARPLYEIWSGQAQAESVDKGAEIFYRQGWICEKLQDVEDALLKYHRSAEIKPVYLSPLLRLSEIYFMQENYSQAEHYYERVLELERETRDTERIFDVLQRLGEIEVKLKKQDAAIGRYEDALALRPDDYHTLRALIPLYFARQDWTKLLSTHDQAIRNAPEPDLIASGLVEKGEVLEEHLSQVESATAHYQKAVEIKSDYLPGWEHLGEVYIRQKKWQDATGALERLVELDEDTGKRTEYNYRLGKIYQESFSDLDKARSYFEDALKLNETHIPSIEAIGSIYLRQKEWEKYLDITHRFVKLMPAEDQEKAIPLYMKMGEVYRDFLEQKEKAIIEFQNVTRIVPDHEDARSALAALYISDKNFYNNAIKENLILLRQNPFRIQSYRDLGKIFEGLNRLDEVYCVYSVLDVLKSLNPQEQMFFEAHQPQVVKESKRGLNEESHEKILIHPDERGPLHDMLVLMGDYLERIFPPELEKLGAKKTFKVQPESTAPIKKLVDELAGNLGLTEYDLYLVPTSMEPKVANTNPPSLIINQEWFNRFRPEERRFLLGRWIEHLKGRHALVMNFSPEKVVRTMFLLAKLYKPDIHVPGLSDSEAQSEMKTLKRAVPRKIRNQMEKAAVGFAVEGVKADVTKWLEGINHTANRAGLLVTNNLPASISAVMKTHPKFKSMRFEDLGDPIPILEQSEEVVEMLMFSISDSYFTLRRRAGFSLLSI